MSLLDDDVLRDAFHELRASEIVAAPRFVIGGGLKPVLTLRPLAAFAVMLLVVLSFVAVIPPSPEPVIVSATFEAPTDFLLETPQMELLQTVPTFGERNMTR